MSLRAALHENILDVLPHLEQEQVKNTVDFLLKEGVKKLADLKHISVSLLKQVLDTIDSCELNANWQSTYNGSSRTSQSSASSASHSRPPLQEIATNVVNTPLPTFDINSPYMPSCVKKAVKAKTRPSSSSRAQFVERIVDKCRDTIPNLQRNVFNKVGREIVEMYPESFKDTLPVSDHGADSLIAQLKNKFDNDRRPQRKKTSKELEAPSGKQAFGCISWNPALPANQTQENQVIVRNELQTMHKVSMRDWDWRIIKSKMEESFYLQRKEINGTLVPKPKKSNREQEDDSIDDPEDMTIVELNKNWPFLFTCKGINKHFHLLTGVDMVENLSEFINQTGQDLIDFFTTECGGNDNMNIIKRKMQKAEKQGHGNTTLCGVILMLIEYLKDKKDELMTFVEATTTIDEAQNTETITYPEESTPFLIFAGSSIYDFEKIYFSIDKQVLCSVRSIFDAIVILFSSYYVFNYVYNSKLSSFLMFIQRKIAGIESVNGSSKCLNALTQRKSNERISKLSNKFAEAKEKWKEQDN